MLIIRRDQWMERGRCRGIDPNLFIPGRGQSVEPALAVCNGGSYVDRHTEEVVTFVGACPVRQQCREYQERENEMGVWGGVFFPTKEWRDPLLEVTVVVEVMDGRPQSA